MRLLLTRAAGDAVRTRAALEAGGHEVVVSPLTEIVATWAGWPLGDVAAIVATSAQAFAMAPAVMADARMGLPLYLVGQRTLDAARRRGFHGPAIHAPDAANLLAILGAQLDCSRRLVYLAGRDRKPDVEATFTARGQAFDVVETYEARAIGSLTSEASSGLRDGRIDAVLHFSRRNAVLFLAATERTAAFTTDLTHFCLSEDVAAPLREAACRHLKTAKAPNEAALLSLLEDPERDAGQRS